MAAAAERTPAVVEQLRERIRQLQAAPRTWVASLRTGVGPFDALLPGRGLPLGSAVELCGAAASGRTSLALRAVAAAHGDGRLAAYVDGPGELYAPAASALGVDLTRLLRVRPREPGQLVWSAVQLARSGAFTCVVLDLGGSGVRPRPADTKRLADAAFRGGSLLLLLTSPEAPGDGMLRVEVEATVTGLRAEVVRSRQGGMGARAVIPWEQLHPALGAQRSDGRVVPAPRPVSVVGLLPGLPRERSAAYGNGCGRGAGRPGRDVGMPPLGSMLVGSTGRAR